VATLADLARHHTSLERADIAHLHELVREWGMLADFCFADLFLYAPAGNGRWIVLAQVRPLTSQTLYVEDWVGAWATENEVALLTAVHERKEIVRGEIDIDGETVHVLGVPVVRGAQVIGVLTREWSIRVGRVPGELEMTYVGIFERFAEMIAAGTFPFASERSLVTEKPRVGDGVMVVDSDARVRYASPNAVSALHRVGISANAVGLRLAELGFDDSAVRAAFEACEPITAEVQQSPDVTLVNRCIPLVEGGAVVGGVLLVRDVSELRLRDRLLLSKDATIREIHHRVKNNLQTISSLLRLQGRRLQSAEAKSAIDESVRRIRTIALVHETLSREAGDDIAFAEIVRPLTRMAEESLQSPDRPVRFKVRGDGGKLPAAIATPLSVVLTELLQNAADHGFDVDRGPGRVVVALDNDRSVLTVRVTDDGVGLPEGFSLDAATGLGLSIVRTLVTTELAGSIEMRRATADDFHAAGIDDADDGTGTVVELRVPLERDGL
jgi:two-component sensor histidine kinase